MFCYSNPKIYSVITHLHWLSEPVQMSNYKTSFFITALEGIVLSTYLRFSQSKMLLTIDERGSKIARNSVFEYHLSLNCQATNGNHNSVSNDF